jgi:hypothetical protein
MDKLKLFAEGKEQNAIDFTKYKKQIKSKVKNVFKSSKHQSGLNILTEYALIEKTLGDEIACENILMNNAFTTASELEDYQSAMEYSDGRSIFSVFLRFNFSFSGNNYTYIINWTSLVAFRHFSRQSSDSFGK